MAPASSKLYTDDVSLLMVLIDTNPFFWSSMKNNDSFTFSKFLSHVISFLNSILLLSQLNQVVVIATGHNSCDYIFDSSDSPNQRAECMLEKLEEFVDKDESLSQEDSVDGVGSGFSLGHFQWLSAIYKGCFVQGHSIRNLGYCVFTDLRMGLDNTWPS